MSITTARDVVNENNGKAQRYDAIELSESDKPRFQRFIDAEAKRWYTDFRTDELARINRDLRDKFGLPGDEGLRLSISNRIEVMNINQTAANQNNEIAMSDLREYLRNVIDGEEDDPRYERIRELIDTGKVTKRNKRFFLEGGGKRMSFVFI